MMKQGNKILIFLAVYLGVGAAFCCYCKKFMPCCCGSKKGPKE